jgi:hypothetical protein
MMATAKPNNISWACHNKGSTAGVNVLQPKNRATHRGIINVASNAPHRTAPHRTANVKRTKTQAKKRPALGFGHSRLRGIKYRQGFCFHDVVATDRSLS